MRLIVLVVQAILYFDAFHIRYVRHGHGWTWNEDRTVQDQREMTGKDDRHLWVRPSTEPALEPIFLSCQDQWFGRRLDTCKKCHRVRTLDAFAVYNNVGTDVIALFLTLQFQNILPQ